MKRKHLTPLGALTRGILAGLVGSAAQAYFFKVSAKITPAHPEGAFEPPEGLQKSEMSTETVARRFVESFMQRGPLSPDQKATGGQLVHFGFGAGWGALYGMACESFPALRKPGGAIAFGALVWMLSDNVILPAFKVSGWPNRYYLKNHAYALTAHIPYALAVWGTFGALRPGMIDGVRRQVAQLPRVPEVLENSGVLSPAA